MKNKIALKKQDIILFTSVLAAGIVLLGLNTAAQEPGAVVRIVSGQEVHGVYSLAKDAEIIIAGENSSNVVAIYGGKVIMKEADCPGGDCVRQHAVDRTGQSIVCLPNRVLITVERGFSGQLDSVAY